MPNLALAQCYADNIAVPTKVIDEQERPSSSARNPTSVAPYQQVIIADPNNEMDQVHEKQAMVA